MNYPSTVSGTVDYEAEAAVLAALFSDPEVLYDVIDHVRPEDFGVPAFAAILEAIVASSSKGLGCDRVVVTAELERAGYLGTVVRPEVMQDLLGRGAEAMNIPAYVEVIKDRALKRGTIRAARAIASVADDTEVSGIKAVNEAERIVFALGEHGGGAETSVVSIGEALTKALEEVRGRDGEDDDVLGVSTGFDALDNATMGFRPGQVIILAGRPGMGKTSVALQIAAKIAEAGVGRVLFLSHEMTEGELAMRLLSAYMGASLRDLQSGRLLGEQEERILEVAERVGNLPLDFVDRPPQTHIEMMSLVRRRAKREPIAAVFVDYVQMMKGVGRKDRTRAEELGDIAYGAKEAAKELGCPFVLLSQLNRGVEGRVDKRPMSSDLRESGALEQAADLIMFIHRPGAYDPNVDQKEAELLITKQRNGQSPLSVPLHWDGKSTRYLNVPGVLTAQEYEAPPSGGGRGGGRGSAY